VLRVSGKRGASLLFMFMLVEGASLFAKGRSAEGSTSMNICSSIYP
jgi:hypothetical protein